MPRTDISNDLIHFTKGDSMRDAFENLCSILEQGSLIGSAGCIKGGFKCVCFSEAPISTLEEGLVNPDYYTKYSPFGVMVQKYWLYDFGGRPAIYQSDAECSQLPDKIKWRHVRYEPTAEPKIDFTWEREWRVHCDAVPINPEVAAVIVENKKWAQELIERHQLEQDSMVYKYSQILDDDIAELYREPFLWKIVALS